MPIEESLCRAHVPATFLERGRHCFQLARLRRPVVRAARLVIGGERLRVLLFRPRIRLDGLLEFLDVAGEGDEVVMSRGLHLGELGLRAAPLANCLEEQERDDRGDQQGDDHTTGAARLAATITAPTTPFGGDTVDEVEERGGHSRAAMGGERLGRQAAGNALGQDAVASGAEVRPDHGGIGAPEAKAGMDRLEHAVRTAAGFQLDGVRQDRDVDGSGACAVDFRPQPVLIGGRGRKLCRRVDVHGIGVQGGDRAVDDRPSLGDGHDKERRGEGGRDQQERFHRASRARGRLRAP